jgi:2,4-dienoyl-CoA reductase-like NADH-dependent reductase (Old Yellow Enzyme family)
MSGAKKFPTLFTEAKIGDLVLKNRFALAPLTRARSINRIPNDMNVEYYKQRAGAGLLITEATTISEGANGWVDTPGLYTDEMVQGWKKVTAAVHERNSKIFAQLWHIGRQSHSSFLNGERIVSASNVTMQSENGAHTADGGYAPHEEPRPLETNEVEEIVQDYKKAAENAMNAGFDGVEVHGANGYLIDQFLQSRTNKRTDKYGGSIENQFRFLREIIEEVITVVPKTRVGVRLSPGGIFGDMGTPEYREVFMHAVTELGKIGIAYIHICDGLAWGHHDHGPPIALAEFKEVVGDVTQLIGSVGYTPETAEEQLKNGAATMIAFGRPFMGNPDFPERVYDDLPLAETIPFDQFFSPDMPTREKYSTGYGYIDHPRHPESKEF